MFLYCSTFLYIKRHNNKTARSGILPLDTIKRRKQQNKLNIMVTFWAWLAQLVTNIVYIILMLFIFGKEQFYHILLAICTICLNFNIRLPYRRMTLHYIFKMGGQKHWSSGHGRGLCKRGCQFESQRKILDGNFFTFIFCKILLMFKKTKNKLQESRDGPFCKLSLHSSLTFLRFS